MISVEASGPRDRHLMFLEDAPYAGTNIRGPMERLHRNFGSLIFDNTPRHDPAPFEELVRMFVFAEEERKHEQTIERETARGVRHERGLSFNGRSDLRVSIRCRALHSSKDELGLEMFIGRHQLAPLGTRLSINRVQTVEEYVARLVFYELERLLLAAAHGELDARP